MDTSGQFVAARRRMISDQLQNRGIRSSSVLDAMERVPRERFVLAEMQDEAYSDQALPIDCGQTISQPYIVALMTEALNLSGSEHVLEVGTGSGYQAAILAELAGDVVTLERHRAISERAADILAELGYRNVRCIVSDGSRGWPDDAPYDRIIVTAAARDCPPALLEQLREGGVLVGPFGGGMGQMLQAIRKHDGKTQTVDLTACRFVPLIEN